MDKHPVLIDYLLEVLDGGSTLPGTESEASPIQSIVNRLKERHPWSETPVLEEPIEKTLLRKGVVADPIAVSSKQDQQPAITLQLKDVDSMMVRLCSRRAPAPGNLARDEWPPMYVCARLWVQSDLMEFKDMLKNFETPEAVQASNDLLGLKSPWIQGDAARNCKQWAQEVCESLKLEALGRFLVPVLLKYICDCFISDPTVVINKCAELANVIQQWEPANTQQLIGKQILLKEL